MKKELFLFQMKRHAPFAVLMGVLMSLLAFGAALLYTEETVAALSEARAQAPVLFAAFGIGGSTALLDHMASLLHGFLFPVLGFAMAARLAALLFPVLIESGEISHYLALPIRRAGFAQVQGLVLLGCQAISVLISTIGTWLSSLLPGHGQVNLLWLLTLSFGQLCLWTFSGGAALMVAAGRDEKRGTAARILLLVLAFYLVKMVSLIPAVPRVLALLTPYSLFHAQALAKGRLEPEVLILPLLGLCLFLIGSRRFAKRDLPI